MTIQATTAPTTPAQPVPPIEAAQPPITTATPAPVQATVDVDTLVKQAIESARKEEKAKLHKQMEEERSARKAAEDKLKAQAEAEAATKRSQLPVEERVAAEIDALRQQNAESQARFESLLQQQAKQQQDYQLSIYRERRMREAQVPDVVAHLVGGDSPDAIETTIAVARAEYLTLQAHFAAQFAAMAPAPASTAPAATMSMPAPTAPVTAAQVGVTPTNPAPAPTSMAVDIAALTSPEAIRSGAYARNREAIQAALRMGQALPPGVTIPMRPMTPQVIAGLEVPQATTQFAPPAAAPQPAMQHQTMPNGVQQPMGLASPQVTPAHMPVAPMPAPSNQGPLAAAAAAAHAALQNPALAAARAGTTGPQPAVHAEYGFRPGGGAQAPSAQALLTGHPMIRG